MFFLSIDGDKIGAKLEALIITEELEQASLFSDNVTSAVCLMKKFIQEKRGMIVFSGGDNILAKFEDSENSDLIAKGLIQHLNNIFFESTGCTMSIGIGSRPRDAFLALRLAKGSDTKLIDLRCRN